MRVHADLSPLPPPPIAGNGRADGTLQPGMSYAARIDRAPFRAFGGYRRWLTRAMSLSVSEACEGLGEGMLSGVVLIM